MKISIVKPSMKIISCTEDILKTMEVAGRVCYKSEDKITEGSADKIIKALTKAGHHSVLEHGSVTVRIIGSRAMSHELVRHRIAAYSQESQRYCDYGKLGFQAIIPPTIGDLDEGTYAFVYDLSSGNGTWYCHDGESVPFEVSASDDVFDWLNDLRYCYERYLHYRDKGKPAEDARYILPNACKTEIVATYNMRTWIHLFDHRGNNKHAQWEIRELFFNMEKEFIERWPCIFDIKCER